MVPSILTLDFGFIFVCVFFNFWGPNVLLLGPTHVVEQLSFSMISSIMHNLGILFDFFWALMGYFLGSGSWDSTEWTVRASFC